MSPPTAYKNKEHFMMAAKYRKSVLKVEVASYAKGYFANILTANNPALT